MYARIATECSIYAFVSFYNVWVVKCPIVITLETVPAEILIPKIDTLII